MNKTTYLWLGIAVLAAGCSTASKQETQTPATQDFPHIAMNTQPDVPASGRSPASTGSRRQAREGVVLFKLKEGASLKDREGVTQRIRKHRFRTFKKFESETQILVSDKDSAAPASNDEIIQDLMSSGAVEFAEPDVLVYPDFVPNDPNVGQQWHHAKIQSYNAWNATLGESKITVASCDTGVDPNHPDLKAGLLAGYNSEDKNATNTVPLNPHGTMTAGLIAARTNNGIGVSGVAGGVSILPVRMSNSADGSAYYSAMVECINYAANRGVKVVNLSFGVSDSQAINSAARYLKKKGGLLVVAAGNSGADLVTGIDSPDYLLVGAVAQDDLRTSWSNYGNAIDLMAPGTDILTTYQGGDYAYGTGTSFSAPIVSGVAALIYSMYPSFTASQVQSFILNSASQSSTNSSYEYGKGRLNALAAVNLAISKIPVRSIRTYYQQRMKAK